MNFFASLIIRMITGATPVPGAAFGRGTGPIYMDNTYCFGDEDWLLDCAFDPHTADCHHGRDVGVICSIQGTV